MSASGSSSADGSSPVSEEASAFARLRPDLLSALSKIAYLL